MNFDHILKVADARKGAESRSVHLILVIAAPWPARANGVTSHDGTDRTSTIG